MKIPEECTSFEQIKKLATIREKKAEEECTQRNRLVTNNRIMLRQIG